MGIVPTDHPIRVANIIEEGKLGGPQVRIAMVASLLKGKVETTVIMPSQNSELFRERCDELGVSYKAIFMTRITKEWRTMLGYILFSPFEVIRLVKLIHSGRYDIVHVSGGSWQYKGAIAGKLTGCKVIWHLNDTQMPAMFRNIYTKLSFLADAYLYSSERTKKYYKSFSKKNRPDFIILPPVDTNFFHPEYRLTLDEELESQWAGKLVVGTIANINPIKGIETFIKMASYYCKKSEDVVFVVVGPVYERQRKYFEKLVLLARDMRVSLSFIGGRTDTRSILKRFDIYVCSSISESGPMTLFEAMAMGKAIVSTNVGDVSVLINHNHNGFIVDAGDHEAMAEYVHVLADNKVLAKMFGSRSREVAIKRLDVSICAEKHLKAYKALAVIE